MRIGVANVDGVSALVAPLGGQWLDMSRAYHDYQKVIDYIDGQTIHSIEELLARGLFRPSFFERVFDFVQKPGMFHEYALREEPRFLKPVRPNKIVAIGRNYRCFIREGGYEVPDEPVFHAKSASVCIGPDEPIVIRERYGRVEHEGELAVLIGCHAQDASPGEARNCIAGYTLLNDVTARELQRKDIQRGYPWYRSKNLATFCPIGPMLALPETMGWPVEVDLEVHVNGELRQKANTRDLIFNAAEVVSAISQFIPLEPGDIVSTGTPEGVSEIVPGDVVEVCVPEIGVLRNPVVSGGP